jgi:hypothetical protein
MGQTPYAPSLQKFLDEIGVMMMKKPPQVLKGLILLLTLLCFFIPQESVQAALIIATDMTWSGAVSVDRDEAVKNGVILTVEPGTIITLAAQILNIMPQGMIRKGLKSSLKMAP